MAEIDTLIKETFKYAGLGSLKEVYSFAYNWLDEEGFDTYEEKYNEKILGDAKEIEIGWVSEKKITDYFKMKFKIKYKILNMTEVEVEVDGKRKKMNKFGELKFEVKVQLIKDWTSKWEGAGHWRFLREWYNKYIIPTRTEDMEEEAVKKAQTFRDNVKAFLELEGQR